MIKLFSQFMINVMQLISLLYRRIVNFMRIRKEMRNVEFLKLEHNNRGYSYKSSNSKEMGILNLFLDSECGDNFFLEGYRELILDENWNGCAGNITMIEKEDGYIYLSDLYPDEDEEDDECVEMKIPIDQLIKIIDEWHKIINLEQKPKEIIIKRKDDQFTFETRD